MNLFELYNHINTNEDAIQFLRARGIFRFLENPPRCTLIGCQREMTQVKRRSLVGDGVGWRCPSHKGRKLSIRHGKLWYAFLFHDNILGSFLEKSNLEPKKFVLFACLWAIGTHHLQKKMCGLSDQPVTDWSNFLRGICSRHLLENPIRLGGIGRVVQIGMYYGR